MTTPLFHEGDAAVVVEFEDGAWRAHRTTVSAVGDHFVVDAAGNRLELGPESQVDVTHMDDIWALEFERKGENFPVVHEELAQEHEGPEVEGYGYDR